MIKLTKQEALNRFLNNKEVYRIYDDGSEGLVESVEGISDPAFSDGDFYYETIGVPVTVRVLKVFKYGDIVRQPGDIVVIDSEYFVSLVANDYAEPYREVSNESSLS